MRGNGEVRGGRGGSAAKGREREMKNKRNSLERRRGVSVKDE